MSKPFDVSSKITWEQYPEDFVAWLGLAGEPAVVIDADVAAVSGATDKVIRVGRGRSSWLLMVEALTSYKSYIPERTQWHSTLLAHRHKLPVRSVIVLLRPAADGPAMTGLYERACPQEPAYLSYRVVRLWQVPFEELLSGGPGLLPFAPVAAVPASHLASVVHRVKQRIESEVPPDFSSDLLASAYLLLGLRYDKIVISALKREVVNMEESITYQEVVGIGQLKEARKLIVRHGTRKFGKRNRKIERALEAITDLERLEVLSDRLLEIKSWDELFTDS